MFGEGIGLTPKHVMTIMAEADNNDDGVIEYKEFLPAAAEMIKVRYFHVGLVLLASQSHSCRP